MFGQPRLPRIPQDPKAKNKLIYAIVIAILVVVALISGRMKTQQEQAVPQSDADFQIHVIDVGQGDSILVLADGHAMLVDSGDADSGSTVCSYLKGLGVEKLDYAVATHLHFDHIGGFSDVLKQFPAEQILEPSCPDDLLPTNTVYELYLDAAEASGADCRTAKAGEIFSLGKAQVEVLAPADAIGENLNNDSLVFRVTYGDASALLTGDMEHEEEDWLLAQGRELQADFLKVSHHGSANGSGEAFLAAVRPQFAAISCAKQNDYGHPSQEALDRLAAYTDEVYVTADGGSIVFLYDAETGQKRVLTAGQKGSAD